MIANPRIARLSSVLTIIAIASLCVGASTAKAAESATTENVKSISVTVESVDVKNRLLSLRGPQGRSMMLEVPPDVFNLSKVKAGDKLKVRYRDSIAAVVRPKGSSEGPNDNGRTSQRGNSSMETRISRTTTVVIQSVNKSTYAVAFKDADGFSRDTVVKDPEMQKFVATLKSGDVVDVTYSEALAVGIELEK
jgi:hypothetical protein